MNNPNPPNNPPNNPLPLPADIPLAPPVMVRQDAVARPRANNPAVDPADILRVRGGIRKKSKRRLRKKSNKKLKRKSSRRTRRN
jgi:hypothetical protein